MARNCERSATFSGGKTVAATFKGLRPGGVAIDVGVGPEPIEVKSMDLIFGSRKLEGALTGDPATGDATPPPDLSTRYWLLLTMLSAIQIWLSSGDQLALVRTVGELESTIQKALGKTGLMSFVQFAKKPAAICPGWSVL